MKIVTEIGRPSQSILNGYKKLFSGAITDAMNLSGGMVSEIKPTFRGAKIVGPAVTVSTYPGDVLTVLKAIDVTRPGDVIVIDGRGHKDSAIWGEMTSRSAMRKGVVGVVIDGAIRDIKFVIQLKFPVFARAIAPNDGGLEYLGKINVPIQCGGVTVRPGDIIFGDDDGVVVIPQERAEEVLKTARSIARDEKEMISKIEKGLSIGQIMEVDKIIEEKEEKRSSIL